MRLMNCVSCGKPMTRSGKTERCTCGGAWVSEAALLAMAEQRTGTFVHIEWKARRGAVRSCPQCGQGMAPVSVGSVALDRCVSHGIWFDAAELDAVLARAGDYSERDGFDAPREAAPEPRKKVEWTRVADDEHSTTGSLGAVLGSMFLDRRS